MLVLHINLFLLAEENGPGKRIFTRTNIIEVESGPVTAGSSLERRACLIKGHNAAIVSECIEHSKCSSSWRALLFGPRV